MSKLRLYSLLLSGLAVAGAAATGVQPLQKTLSMRDASAQQTMMARPAAGQARAEMRLNRQQHAPARAMKALPGAPDDLQIVTEVPEPDALKLGVKSGAYYYYSWLIGMGSGLMSSNISQYEIVDGKFYMNFPFAMMDTNGFLVGDVEGNTITIQFPQWVNHYEDEDYLGNPYYMDNYALLCEFVESEEGDGTGWFYPSENQTLTLTINEDGVIENPEWENYLIGSCEWVTEEYDYDLDDYVPVENPYWVWDGNGDHIISITECTEEAVEVPAGLTSETWTMINGVSGLEIDVAIDDDDMYLTGLFKEYGMNTAIKGKINGDKVTFETGQYLGAYMYNMTLLYFQGATLEYDENGKLLNIELLPALEFTYDKEKKDLRAENAAVFSSMKETVRYYTYYDAPHIFMPDAALTGHNLIDPVVLEFYPVEDGYSGEIDFNFPTIDADGNMLDKDKLFYNVFVDDEIFTLYADEYPDDVPEGEDSMEDIPYTLYGWNIYYNGNNHYFYFFIEGYDSMAIQTIYRDGDFENRSKMVYAYGAPGVGVESVADYAREKSVEYYDLQGCRVSRGYKGVMIRKATLEDGSTVTSKIVRF